MKPPKVNLQMIARVFRPSAPVEDPKMFIGRTEQKRLLHRALLTPGKHVALYGQRGVGKTSLLNIVLHELSKGSNLSLITYSCGHKDTYEDIFKKYLARTNQLLQQQITKKKTARKLESKLKIPVAEGGLHSAFEEESTVSPVISGSLTPDAIATDYCVKPTVFIIDEFDRVKCHDTKEMIAETIKILADSQSKTKIILTGVSNSALDLVGSHPSIIRNLVTLELSVMTYKEIEELITLGFQELCIKLTPDVFDLVVKAANGLPYFAHLLCEEMAVRALSERIDELDVDDFFAVLNTALANISSVVHSSFEAMSQSAPPSYSFEQFSEIPSSIRRLVVMAFALVPNNDLQYVGQIANELALVRGMFLPESYRDLSEVDVEAVLTEVCDLSDFLIRFPNGIAFRDAFSRGYTWLQAARAFGKEPIIKVMQ